MYSVAPGYRLLTLSRRLSVKISMSSNSSISATLADDYCKADSLSMILVQAFERPLVAWNPCLDSFDVRTQSALDVSASVREPFLFAISQRHVDHVVIFRFFIPDVDSG
jgi:hypothetical protein